MREPIQKNIQENNFISLNEASRQGPYSLEYLSLRARQGKLKAAKLGRNWFTTKEWLNEYIEGVGKIEKQKKSTRKTGINDALKTVSTSQTNLVAGEKFFSDTEFSFFEKMAPELRRAIICFSLRFRAFEEDLKNYLLCRWPALARDEVKYFLAAVLIVLLVGGGWMLSEEQIQNKIGQKISAAFSRVGELTVEIIEKTNQTGSGLMAELSSEKKFNSAVKDFKESIGILAEGWKEMYLFSKRAAGTIGWQVRESVFEAARGIGVLPVSQKMILAAIQLPEEIDYLISAGKQFPAAVQNKSFLPPSLEKFYLDFNKENERLKKDFTDFVFRTKEGAVLAACRFFENISNWPSWAYDRYLIVGQKIGEFFSNSSGTVGRSLSDIMKILSKVQEWFIAGAQEILAGGGQGENQKIAQPANEFIYGVNIKDDNR